MTPTEQAAKAYPYHPVNWEEMPKDLRDLANLIKEFTCAEAWEALIDQLRLAFIEGMKARWIKLERDMEWPDFTGVNLLVMSVDNIPFAGEGINIEIDEQGFYIYDWTGKKYITHYQIINPI